MSHSFIYIICLSPITASPCYQVILDEYCDIWIPWDSEDKNDLAHDKSLGSMSKIIIFQLLRPFYNFKHEVLGQQVFQNVS